MTAVIGISAFYHDSAAALVVDNDIVAAVQEERFSGVKHDSSFPLRAIRSCLDQGGLKDDDIDFVAFYEKPFLKLDRLIETYVDNAPFGFRAFRSAVPSWTTQKLRVRKFISQAIPGRKPNQVVFCHHHMSHAASAFFPSPFRDAAILTMDGVGEWSTATLGVGHGSDIKILKEIRFPHSLGLFYSAFTQFAGFRVNGGEYKLMGLAPYGEPSLRDLFLDRVIDLREDGSFNLNMRLFGYCNSLRMTSRSLEKILGAPCREPGDPIRPIDLEVAASVQSIVEEVMLRAAKHLHGLTGVSELCLAGGVALNSVANGRLEREGPFRRVWAQPAAGDAGGALGSALYVAHALLGGKRELCDRQKGSLLGPEFDDARIGSSLTRAGVRWLKLDDVELVKVICDALERQHVVGIFDGRMEFGPRALGARSLIADPRTTEMRDHINNLVKNRESFRPLAPVVLSEYSHEWFELPLGDLAKYMLTVTGVHTSKRTGAVSSSERLEDRLATVTSTIPAVTHVDLSARVQVVHPDRPSLLRRVLECFNDRTGCPVLINTSFNVRGQPIVCAPEQAIKCFLSTELDSVAIGSYWISKELQDATKN